MDGGILFLGVFPPNNFFWEFFMKKISICVVALLVVLACAVFVSCTMDPTLGLSEININELQSGVDSDDTYALTVVHVTRDSSGRETSRTTENKGNKTGANLKATATALTGFTGAKAYASLRYSKVVVYKYTMENGVKTVEWYYQYLIQE